ncbi:MAG: fibronectin type III domain-containing protein, partial [Candidatus Kapaibacterium sp.]
MKITGDNKTNVLLTYDNLVSLSINDDSKSTVELDGIYDLVQPLLLTAIMTAVNEITLTYDSALDETSIPDLIDFVCDYSGGAMEVSGVVVSGSTVVLTTDIPVTYNTTLSLAYIPGSSPIKSASGVNASAFSEAVDLSIVAELFPNGNSDDLILSDVTSSSIRLDWINGSTDETAISIERKTDIVEWAEIKTLAAGTKYYIDDTCDSSTNYYYRVRAEKTGYYSDYSNQENETTLASGPDG